MGELCTERIIGYYANNACMTGSPAGMRSGNNSSIENLLTINEAGNIQLISPPFSPENIVPCLPPQNEDCYITDTPEPPPVVLSAQDDEDIRLVGGLKEAGFWTNDQDLQAMQNYQGARIFHVYGGKKLSDERLAEIAATLDQAFIVSLDQEGGPISRLVWAEGVTQITLRALAETNFSPEQKYTYAIKIGNLTARYLKIYGINLNFGPILDLHTPQKKRNISDTDPNLISDLAQGYMEGLQSEGVAYCAKHFPDSWTTGDTDQQLISSSLPMEQLFIDQRYQSLINADLPAIMMSHLILNGETSPDRNNPASLSRAWGRLLRNRMGFNGLIVTDSLGAGSITEYRHARHLTHEETVIQAYQAGADLVIGNMNTAAILEQAVLDGRLSMDQIRESAQRIRDFSARFPRPQPLGEEERRAALVELEKEANALWKEIIN
jgi:beta-N-acetylhexosaminidase